MTTDPAQLGRMRAGLVAFVRENLPGAVVVWAPSEYPRANTPALAAIRILSGPSRREFGTSPLRVLPLPVSATAQVVAPVAGQEATLRASGLSWHHVVQTGEGAGDVRDGLLASAQADPPAGVSFAGSGADAIAIGSSELGDLRQLSGAGPIAVAATATALARVDVADLQTRAEVQIYTTERGPFADASALAQRLLAARRQRRAPLATHGVSIVGTPPVVTLDALSGPGWETRAAITLDLRSLFYDAVAIEAIETVTVATDTRTPSVSLEDTVEIP